MHTEPRGQNSIDVIVVHINVGPEVEGGAAGLAAYLRTIDAGYHETVDDKTYVVCAADDLIVWGAGGMNSHGWHICLIGTADQTAQQWDDAYSRGELDVAAGRVAEACRRLQIPAAKIGPADIQPGNIHRGICGHHDVSQVYAKSGGHYDPGPNFPWAKFIAAVNQHLHPVQKVTPMYNPPLVTEPIVADLACPTGGAWVLCESGAIYAFGGAPFRGGANGKPYFAGRHAARLVLRRYGFLGRNVGYTIIATSGESYSLP